MTARRVTLDGGAPWGFRMQGGAEVGQPLRISRVNPGSKAASGGVREGDVISTIDGLSTSGLSKQDAHGLLRQAGPTLTLGLSGSGSRRKANAKRSSEAVVVNGSAQPVVQEPSSSVEATSTSNDRPSGITNSDSKGRRKVRRGLLRSERGLDIGVPGSEPPRKVTNIPDRGLPRSRSNPEVAGARISPSKARRQRAYRAKMRRSQERADSPALETVPEDIPGESKLTEDEPEPTAPEVKTRKPMMNLLHAESIESDDAPMVMEVLDTGYLPLTDTGHTRPRDTETVPGLESFVIVVTEEVNPSEHESEVRIKEIEEFVVTPQIRKESSSPELIRCSSKNDTLSEDALLGSCSAEDVQSSTVIPIRSESPPTSPTTKYPPLEEAYLDHKIQQLDLAYKRVSSPTGDIDEDVDIFKEHKAHENEEEVVWEEASELFLYQDPLLVKDFETGAISPDLFSRQPESSTDSQDSVQAAGGGDSVVAVTEEKTEPLEVEITTTEVSDDAVTCLVGDYKKKRHRYTLPSFMHSQPRFLDVILEECSDGSDSEKSSSKPSRRNTIPTTSHHEVSSRLARPLRIPGINFKRRRDPRSFEGDCQPAKKMVVKMAEVKVEKLEPTLYDVKIEEVSSTPAQYGEVSVLPESESGSSVDLNDTNNYTVLEQLPDSSDGENFTSKCLPRSNDGVEIVYLETSSSASSLSSRTLTNREDDHDTEFDFDRISIPISDESRGSEDITSRSSKTNLTSDMPDIIQDANTPISMWLQTSFEPSAMEGSITSLESEPRPTSFVEDITELTSDNELPSVKFEPPIKDSCTQTGDRFPPNSETRPASLIEDSVESASDNAFPSVKPELPIKDTCTQTSDSFPPNSETRPASLIEDSASCASELASDNTIPTVKAESPINTSTPTSDSFSPNSEKSPATLIEDSAESDNAFPSVKRDPPIEETCIRTSDSFPPVSENITEVSDDFCSNIIDTNDSPTNINCGQTDKIVESSDILESSTNQNMFSTSDICENINLNVEVSDEAIKVSSKEISVHDTVERKEQNLIQPSYNFDVTDKRLKEDNQKNNFEWNNEENVQSSEQNRTIVSPCDSIERTNKREVIQGVDNLEQSDQNDIRLSAVCGRSWEVCDFVQKKELSPKIVHIPTDFLANSSEKMVDEEEIVPDLDTLINSLKKIAEIEVPIKKSCVPIEESFSMPEPSPTSEQDSPTKESSFWPGNKSSSKNPIARMIEDFFKSKRRKEKSDSGRESRTVTSPTYRSYSESVVRSTGGSSITSPVTSRSQSRSQTPCSQSNSYSADMSRNGSLSPALIRELECVLKSHPFNRYRESESSSQDSPVRTFYPRKRSIPSSSSYTHSPSRSPIDLMSPPPYSRQVSSSSAASQSTAVYNPRLSPVSSDETESTLTSKEPEKSSPERRGVFEQVFRAINLKKGFTTAARPSKLHLNEPRADRSCAKGYTRSPRLHRSASEPMNATRLEKSVSPLSPPPSRNHRGQSLATERTLADGKLVFLSSPPLATSPPPCGRKSMSGKGTRTRDNSHILLCLSPSQRRCFKNRLPTPEESAELLDLHRKFIERRAYHESPAPPPRKHSPKPRSVYADTIDWINSIPLYSSDDDWLAVGENGESSHPSRSLYCPPRPDDGNRPAGVKVSVESNAEIDLSGLLAILREECAEQHSHERLHSSDRRATDSMSPWFTPRSRDASDVDEPVTYVLHAGGKNKYEFRSDCAKNAAINIAKRIEETANKVKWKTEGDATCSKSFSSILKDKLFWNLNNIVDSKEVKPIPKSVSSDCISGPGKPIPGYKISQRGDIAHLREKVTNGDSASLYEDLSPGSKYWKESRGLRAKTHSKDSSKKEVVSRINVQQNQVLPSPPTKHKDPHPKSRPINPSEEERLRDQMYEEYMHQVAERNRRREQKVIKISDPDSVTVNSEQRKDDTRSPIEISKPKGAQLEQEFMDKVRARMAKYGLVENGGSVSPLGHPKLPPEVEKNCVVIKAAGSQKEATVTAVQQLPKHLQEFLSFTVQDDPKSQTAEDTKVGVWSPHQSQDGEEQEAPQNRSNTSTTESPRDDGPPAPIWTPRSAGASPAMERKAFRPVNFESPTLPRKNQTQKEKSDAVPPWQDPNSSSTPPTQSTVSGSVTLGKLASPDSPGRLPRAPNPTMTLLQKAREGQIPKGAHYLDKEQYEAKPSDILYTVRKEYDVSGDRARTITHVEPRKFDGIGPTTKEGIPVVLRSAVRNESKDKWYKKMYDSMHKVKENDEYVTVRYRNNPRKDFENFHLTRRRDGTGDEKTPFMWPGGRSSASSGGGAPSSSTGAGYQSEPELSRGYDSDSACKSKTLDRRRETQRSASATSVTSTPPKPTPAAAPLTTSSAAPSASASSAKAVADSVKYAAEIYKNQPGRIENYEPGHSSISDKEAQQWWDEVLDIFDGWLDERCAKRKYRKLQADARRISMEQRNKENVAKQSFMTHALKESGYESDTQLVVRRRDAPPPPLSPAQQRSAYQTVQKGGDVPLHGLRRAPPDRPKDSPPTEPRRPATFSALKRTAPSRVTGAASTSRSASTPNPPCPPRRRSSKRLSALHVHSTMSLSSSSKSRSKRDTACSDSNVQFLRDRLSVKLGVSDKELPTKSGKKHSSSRERTIHISRIESPPRTIKMPRCSPSPCGRGEYTAKRKYESHRSRKDTGSSTRIYRSPELTSPTEVKKAMLDQKKTKEKNGKSGPVVRSSTTIYSSAKNPKKGEEKSLKVTVAISSKGKELLKTTTSSDSHKRSTTPSPIPSPNRYSPSPPSTISRPKPKRPVTITSLGKERSNGKPVKSASSSAVSLVEETTKRSGLGSLISKSIATYKSKKSSSAKDTSTAKVDDSNGKKARKTRPESIVFPGVDQTPKKISPPRKLTSNGKTKLMSISRLSRNRLASSVEVPGSVVPHKVLKDRNVVEEYHSTVYETKKKPDVLHPPGSDNFFQHLLLRGISPTPSTGVRATSVQHRAQLYLEKSEAANSIGPSLYKSEPTLKSLDVYLRQKKPVSESKFRSLERARISRSSSPPCLARHRFPERDNDFLSMLLKFDSRSESDLDSESPRLRARCAEYARTEICRRSTSEPPASAPPLPSAPRPPPPPPENHLPAASTKDKITVEFRTISPTRSTLTRSPSHRRIQGTKITRSVNTVESIDGIKRTPVRAKSAGEADFVKRERLDVGLGKSSSSLSLTQLADHEDYQAYVLELLHSTKKSERFKELNRFYTNLERIGQLELAASTGDLRPRRKNEEIIDFDRWKQVRTKEKAEAELKVLQNKLKSDQKEKDLLYLPRDVDAMRWKGDRGLRCKEKSVEDLCRHFKKLGEEESELEANRRRELDAQKDVYKPLWRGNSVVNLASNLKNTTASHRGRPISGLRPYETSRSLDRRHSSGYRYEASKIGTRIWSSLSMEQVNKLKCQLNEIYSSGFGGKKPKKREISVENKENYEIIVPPANSEKKQNLHIRSNSLLSREELLEHSLSKRELKRSDSMKADSISSLCHWKDEETSAVLDKKTLSETEKKHLSLTISQEVMDRVQRRKSPQKSVVAPRETMGAVAAAEAKAKIPSVTRYSPLSEETMSPRTCYSLEMSIDDSSSERTAGGTHTSRREKNDFLLVLTPTGDDHQTKNEVKRVVQEWATPKIQKALTATQEKLTDTLIESSKIASASETESASSGNSTKTVIRVGNNEEFQRKVDYFESREDANKERSLTPKIEAHEVVEVSKSITAPTQDKMSMESTSIKRSYSSSSFSDLKELFGESVAGRNYATLPVRRRPPPEVLAASSTESVMPGRSRSTSPDPTKYYRAYIRMVKNGDVRRLKNQFESLDDLTYMCARSGGKRLTVSNRCRSDPELRRGCKVVVRGQEFGDVDWLRRKYEPRTKRRASPVSRKALSPDVRFMPHINVISKTASLQRKSAATPTGSRIFPSTGEVDRIRRKFESELSLLGQMFTSTPDIHELRDIAPYLSCKWVAHQYPLPEPTFSRSVSSLELRRPSTPARPRPASASPGRRPILKAPAPPPPRTSFAGQHFDASIHQPAYRYQPPPPMIPRSRRPWTALDYWWRHCHAARPTVTFKEGDVLRGEDADLPPLPPPVPPAPAPMLLSESRTTNYSEMEDVEKLFTKSFVPLPKGYDSEPESPHRYVDSEVTIRYKSPVSTAARRDADISKEELARRQAEAMRRLYQEERRRKYLTELQDINARRHTDYFTPSQKSPIPLNRYDDFPDERFQSRTPEPRLVARALYNFVGQTPRELSFRRGDIIFVKRQIDKNWFEGEHNAMVGLFPFNYVEILPYDGVRTPTKTREGQARAKYNFIAQTNLELSLIKGELVTLIRRVDNNWFEGRIGNRKGIFPVTYVDVLLEPGDSSSHPQPLTSSKPVASPAAHSLMLNGGAAQMSRHSYTPSSGAISPGATSGSAGPGFPGYSACYGPTGAARINAPVAGSKQSPAPVNQTLHIDTQSEPVPYRALYNYRPQNDDELELVEGDLVLVMEKCDDGWYVGSSQRSGFLGTFPGNYVERI